MEYYSIMLNEKDMKILEILKKNSKLTTQQIAKKTQLPTTTVHNRIKNLEKSGIIKHYMAVLDSKKMGKSLSAYVLAVVDYTLLKERGTTQQEIAKTLSKHNLVDEVTMLTGSHDMIIKVQAKDIEELNNFITVHLRNIGGIEKTETMIALSSF